MKTTIATLRKLIREAIDTHSETVPASTEHSFSVAPPKGSMRLDSPAMMKAKSTVRLIEKQGGEQVDVNDVYKFIKNYEDEEFVLKSTQEFADEYLASKNQKQTMRPGAK